MDAIDPCGSGGTYGGNPSPVPQALAAIEAIEEEWPVAAFLGYGEHLKARFCRDRIARSRRPHVGYPWFGAMVAVEFVTDFDTATPDGDFTNAGVILRNCAQAGPVAC